MSNIIKFPVPMNKYGLPIRPINAPSNVVQDLRRHMIRSNEFRKCAAAMSDLEFAQIQRALILPGQSISLFTSLSRIILANNKNALHNFEQWLITYNTSKPLIS